ncbi:MAG: sensor histidine kinase [Gammaproteobacteria bacterium]
MDSGWSIRGRLFGLWLLMLIVVSIAVYWSTNAVVERSLREGQDRNLQAVAQVILDSAIKTGKSIDFELPYQAFEVLAYSAPERIYYSVFLDSELLSGYDDLPLSKGGEMSGFGGIYREEPTRFFVASKPIRPGSAERFRVVIGQTETSYQKQSSTIAAWIAFAVLASFGLLAIWAELSLRNALKPVVVIERDLIERSADDFSPIERRVPREVVRMVQTLNRIFEQHRGLLQENRAFIAEATHQIKTPIAAILMRAELLEREVEENSRSAVRDLIIRARYASKLATQILTRATLTYREALGEKELVDLGGLTRGILRTLDPVAEIKEVGLTLNDSGLSDLNVFGDRVALREAISCLIDNAIDHAPPLTDVEVSLHRHNKGVCVTVMDRGPGFDEEDLSQPFDTTRRADGHAGLGLLIVEKVAASHRGTSTISNREGGGTRCDLCFVVS